MILRTSLAALAFALAVPTAALAEEAAPQTSAARPTAADAEAFVAAAEKEGYEYSVSAGRVFWINSTYLTDDTNALAAEVGAKGTEMQVRFALEAAKYKDVPGLSEETRRKLDKLRGGIVLPAPTTEGAAAELNTIATELQSIYGKGKGTLDGKPVNGSDIEAAMGEVRDPAKLKEMWVSWHDNVGAPMKDDYARMVDIANQGARELGFKNVGAMWRGQYDMSATSSPR